MNNGNGSFTEVAAAVGLNDMTNTITCTWGDVDNDGDLDLLTTATATAIEYSIASTAFVNLKVFDVQGREVATLINETKSPSSYEVQWNAERFSGGIDRGSSAVYFYRLSAGSHVQVRKMIFLK